ncbi:Rieske 2Fe-2S domain-containing protein [Trinickia sp. NRRL B-1857]|uniref:Rieske 2Fe-2S domain-containing protein n=1 Tax=Trinickia sp. NRRL B-1857 TaxID=3162879 RepID=UPI003D2CD516
MDVPNGSRLPPATLAARGMGARWWPIALSEQVSDQAPLGAFYEGEPIVLYRDGQGQVRALEDRCPHRRAPLSLGRVTPDGQLQCGYHGWTYDGVSGMCTAIPNLSKGERIPSHYMAQPYCVTERDGFVFVRRQGFGENEPHVAPSRVPHGGPRFRGCTTVATPYDEYLAALADGPHLLISLSGLHITNYVSADACEQDGQVGIEWGVVSVARRRNHRFVTDYPWTLRLSCEPNGALLSVELLTRDEQLALIAMVAVSPAARGTTAVNWRGTVLPAAAGLGPALLRARTRLGAAPFRMISNIDGHLLARLARLHSTSWMHPGPSGATQPEVPTEAASTPRQETIHGGSSV